MPKAIDAQFALDFLPRLHTAANAHDPQAVAALCAEDVIWEDPAAPHALTTDDRAWVRRQVTIADIARTQPAIAEDARWPPRCALAGMQRDIEECAAR